MENEEKENKKNHLESCMYSFISLTSPPLLALLLLLNATEKIEIVTIRMAMRSDINYHTSPSPSSLARSSYCPLQGINSIEQIQIH